MVVRFGEIVLAYSAIEQEAIVLKAVWDMIDGMVNFGIFGKLPENEDGVRRTQDILLMFTDTPARTLFNIRLTDFLSYPRAGTFDLPAPQTHKEARASDATFLFHLRRIAANPVLGFESHLITDPVNVFADWLDGVIRFRSAWFPRLDIECDLEIGRMEGIKLCGNIGKHSFTRLSRNADEIRGLFQRQGHVIKPENAYAFMPDFYDWFHDNFFIYQSSVIAEFLNDIRWGIYAYLQPCFRAAYTPIPSEDFPTYSYRIPDPIRPDTIALSMFWDLMNDQRSPPWFPQFTVSERDKRHPE